MLIRQHYKTIQQVPYPLCLLMLIKHQYLQTFFKGFKRVEVLRGPQGTLYGSGSLGGTVRYITNDPVIGSFEGSANLTGSSVNGSDNTGKSLDLVLNIPLGSKTAYRLVTSELDYPGITDYVNVFEVGYAPATFYADASYSVPVPRDGYLYPNFYTSPPVINSVKDADHVEISFLRHKFLFDISDRLKLILSSARQDDYVGGRRQASTGTKYVLNDDCVSLFAANCYSESVYGEYENGALMLEPSQRDVSVDSAELTFDGDNFDIIVIKSKDKKSGSSITDNTGFFAGSDETSTTSGIIMTPMMLVYTGQNQPDHMFLHIDNTQVALTH